MGEVSTSLDNEGRHKGSSSSRVWHLSVQGIGSFLSTCNYKTHLFRQCKEAGRIETATKMTRLQLRSHVTEGPSLSPWF